MAKPETQVVDISQFIKRDISNEEFLRTIFGDQDWKRAHICGFREDPYDLDTLGLRHYWAGGPAWKHLPHFTGDMNQYYTVSLFSEPRRKKALHEATYVILFDDVGGGKTAKVRWDRMSLGPSFVEETSPDNHQVGLLLKAPDPRGGKVTALQEALVGLGLTLDGKDPGQKGVTRYGRLPGGMNRKAAYAKLSGGGFKTRMLWWKPDARYTLEDIADAFGVRAELDAAPDDLPGAGASGGVTVAPGDMGDDLWLDVLSRGGLLKQQLAPGIWDIVCPFIDEHSARADSGSAYLGGGAFKCHHGHCENRGSADFRSKLAGAAGFGEHYAGARKAQLDRQFGDIGGSRDPFAEIRPALMGKAQEQQVRVQVEGRFSGAFTGGGLSPITTGQNWLLKNLAPAEGVGVLFGSPKSGKSFVMLDMLCRLACGMDWYGHRVKRSGLVIYVASEGGLAGARNRVVAWSQEHGNPPGLENLLVWPGALRLGRGHEEDARLLVEWARSEALARGQEVVCVCLDTVNRNLIGDENKTEDMTGFVGVVDTIWRALGGFVWLVHHSGKDANKGLRGSSVLQGAVDAEIELTRDKDAGLSDPGAITLSNLRHAEDGKRYGFILEYRKLGVDEDLEDVGSLVVKEARPPARGGRLGAVERALLDVLIDLTSGDPAVSVTGDVWVREFQNRHAQGDFPDIKLPRPGRLKETIARMEDKGAVRKTADGWANIP